MEPSSVAHDPIADMSPALTNPDMILPYRSRSPSPSPSPYHVPSSFLQAYHQKPLSSLSEEASTRMIHGTGSNPLMSQGESSIGPFRPSLPGAWQTDEDFHAAYDPPKSRSPPLGLSSTLHKDELTASLNSAHIEDGHGEQWNGLDPGDTDGGISPYLDVDWESPFGEGGSDIIRLDDERNGIRAILEEDEDDPSSHAALSIRAEQILANAKKRLIEMEDNLSRARQTLKDGSSSRPPIRESVASQLPPSYNGSENKESRKISTKKHLAKLPNSPGKATGHSRVFSETAVSDFSARKKPNCDPQRASSAMGTVSNTRSFRDNIGYGSNEANGARNPINRNGNMTTQRREFLGPLCEDETTHVDSYQPSTRENCGLEKNGHRYGNSNNSYFNLGRTEQREFTRSRSTMQLRDLREQMEDLKGKVTSLKARTHEDRLQRRSLQTLKAPSPFTVAQDWKEEINSKEQDVVTGEMQNSRDSNLPANQPTNAILRDDLMKDSGNPPQPFYDHRREENSDLTDNPNPSNKDPTSESAGLTETTTFEESTDGDTDLTTNASNMEDSLLITGERHEDRPDAFDYEHFFLHSGIGPLHRPNLARSCSQSSSDSAETTRPGIEETSVSPPEPPSSNSSMDYTPDNPKATSHLRQPSKDSISTVATFATATENNDFSSSHRDRSNHYKSSESSKMQPQSTLRDDSTAHLQVNGNLSQKEKDQSVQNGTDLLPSSDPLHHAQTRTDSHSPTPSSKPVPPTPLSALLSSEIKLGTTDQVLVVNLLKSLQTACRELHNEGDGRALHEVKAWRRRIDAARRTLDGEINMI